MIHIKYNKFDGPLLKTSITHSGETFALVVVLYHKPRPNFMAKTIILLLPVTVLEVGQLS